MSLPRAENHCFLLLVCACQAVFILILYRGGPSGVFRGVAEPPAVADYSRRSDVYSNLSAAGRGARPGALPACPLRSPILVGPLSITFKMLPSERMIMKKNPFVQSGGHYRPPHCFARYKSAILVAYRNQEKYLHHLLYYIHPFLQRQQLSYTIYLVQQVGNGSFNRAKLLNVGVREAMKDEDWDCLVLHDVDLVPENDYNLYICDEYYPKHLASAMDKFQYTLPYKSFFGGVSALTPDHYMKMNGFPNTYWGDDGENDDIAARILLIKEELVKEAAVCYLQLADCRTVLGVANTRIYLLFEGNTILIGTTYVLTLSTTGKIQLSGMKIVQTSPHLGRYRVMSYNEEAETQEPWRRPTSRHNTRKTWKADGMNSLQYRLLSRTKHPLYTRITVDIGYVPPFS